MASLTPEAFATRWAGSGLTERAGYQQHFLDLCDVLDAPKPAETDPNGEFYTFKKGVEKTGGGRGFADVLFKDHFAIEYKSHLRRSTPPGRVAPELARPRGRV
jgi:hypothetical protein